MRRFCRRWRSSLSWAGSLRTTPPLQSTTHRQVASAVRADPTKHPLEKLPQSGPEISECHLPRLAGYCKGQMVKVRDVLVLEGLHVSIRKLNFLYPMCKGCHRICIARHRRSLMSKQGVHANQLYEIRLILRSCWLTFG